MIAAAVTYFSTVWAGEADPLWPHVVLLTVSIFAAFGVGAGILLESPKYSAAVHKVATWLVLGGIAVESLCTVLLFVFDERISSNQQSTIEEQQSKIIALESAFAPRVLEQGGDTARALAKFSSEFEYLVISAPGLEAEETAGQIRYLLKTSGWKEYLGPMPSYGAGRFQEGVRAKFMGAYISDISRLQEEVSAGEQRRKDADIVARTLGRAGNFEIALSQGIAFGQDAVFSTSMQNVFLIAVGPKPFPEALKRAFAPQTPDGHAIPCCGIAESERPDSSMPRWVR